jgi:tetratricopeptide (TPR) repeat protein
VRARMEDPADPVRLREAAEALAVALERDAPSAWALDLGYARHLLADVPAAVDAYQRALHGDERLGELALRGLRSVGRFDDRTWEEWLGQVVGDRMLFPVPQPALRTAHATARAKRKGPAEGLAALDRGSKPETPRTLLLRAGFLRDLSRPDDALAVEREALARAGEDLDVEAGVEALWRRRPMRSFADALSLADDAKLLLARAEGDPWRTISYANNVAFRLREVASAFTWRGEGRTQGLAEGAPKEARAVLDRCVALYETAVGAIPKGAADASFERRWVCAGVCNDLGLMRHYFLDVRDLDAAERHYLRAFELTDGAYMDTYFYNLQYLYGFEKPGNEETWFRLARRAADRILKETDAGGFEPDERKRDAARRDAAGLRALLESRAPVK